MKAYLFQMDHNNCAYELNDYFTVGSGETCRWQHPKMDERHARIERQGKGYMLKDLRSSSGTFLNSQRITEAPLQDGDWIQIGEQTLIFSFSATRPKSIFSLQSRNLLWNQKLEQIPAVAATDFPVLILGPSGSGKEILARELHRISKREQSPFVSVNCCALSESLIESELFGHVRGSFTGAVSDRKGAFESARGGTLFLDEIGDLPLSLQAKLLRALENNEIRPVGSDSTLKTDVRILAATHQNLVDKVMSGQFRADLYYRLNVVRIESPNLFGRMEDFEDLLMCFAKTLKVRFSHSGISRLKKHSWPGNIRELKNTVSRASALFPGQVIDETLADLLIDKLMLGPQGKPMIDTLSTPLSVIKEMERQMILKKMATNRGNQRQTAMELGLPKSTLHDRLRAYSIDPKAFKD
jgi:DNA-binding NtrC family response regulator